jgi:hypothetical protein
LPSLSNAILFLLMLGCDIKLVTVIGRVSINYYRYGVDPNTNVKGTRPLHEALEAASVKSVYQLLRFGADPLLYDYSGNMPVDLAEGDEDLKVYFAALLADLHGKESGRWNVAHDHHFHMPPDDLDGLTIPVNEEAEDSDELEGLGFEVSVQPQPPCFKFPGREGNWHLLSDLKSAKVSVSSKARQFTMPWDDFVKTARCCLLGHHGPTSPANPTDTVTLVSADDDGVRRALGAEPFTRIANTPCHATHPRPPPPSLTTRPVSAAKNKRRS